MENCNKTVHRASVTSVYFSTSRIKCISIVDSLQYHDFYGMYKTHFILQITFIFHAFLETSNWLVL